MAKSYFQIILSDGTTPLTLTNNPAGIEDFSIKYKRSKTYGTVLRSISESLRFVKEGADYIRNLFETKGIDAECSIEIKTLKLSNKTYSSVYTGILDFNTYSEDSIYIEIALIDNANTSLLISREGIDINLLSTEDLDGNTLTGLPAQDAISLSPIDFIFWAEPETANIGYIFTSVPNKIPLIIFPNIYNVTNHIGSDFNESTGQYLNSSGSTKKILFDYSILLGLTGNFGVSSGSGLVTIQFNVRRKGDGSIIYSFLDDYLGGVGNKTTSFSQLITDTLTTEIADGDGEGLYVEFDVYKESGVTDVYLNMNLSGSFTKYSMTLIDESTQPATTAYGLTPLNALKRALKIIGISTTPTSNVFGSGGDYELCYLTTGKRIRGFSNLVPFNISFKDLFSSLNKIFGIWMSDNFQFDNHSTFLSTTTGLTITEFSNVTYKPALDWYFSKVKVGYKNKDYDESNGIIEFNTEFQFSTVNKSDNELDLIPEMRADSFGIEYTRRKNVANFGTEDTEGDNDVFIISCLNDNGTIRPEIGSDFTTVTGLKKTDKYYNFRLTPKNNLIRNGLYLNTSLKNQTKEVKYIKSKNNIDLAVDGINELDSDYLTSNSKTLNPVFMSFDTPLTDFILFYLKYFNYTKVSCNSKVGYLIESDFNLYKKTCSMTIILI